MKRPAAVSKQPDLFEFKEEVGISPFVPLRKALSSAKQSQSRAMQSSPQRQQFQSSLKSIKRAATTSLHRQRSASGFVAGSPPRKRPAILLKTRAQPKESLKVFAHGLEPEDSEEEDFHEESVQLSTFMSMQPSKSGLTRPNLHGSDTDEVIRPDPQKHDTAEVKRPNSASQVDTKKSSAANNQSVDKPLIDKDPICIKNENVAKPQTSPTREVSQMPTDSKNIEIDQSRQSTITKHGKVVKRPTISHKGAETKLICDNNEAVVTSTTESPPPLTEDRKTLFEALKEVSVVPPMELLRSLRIYQIANGYWMRLTSKRPSISPDLVSSSSPERFEVTKTTLMRSPTVKSRRESLLSDWGSPVQLVIDDSSPPAKRCRADSELEIVGEISAGKSSGS